MGYLFFTIFYAPLYNAFVFLVSILPGRNAGWAVIALTILIRVILFPLSRSAIKTQLQMKSVEVELQKIRSSVPDKNEQAKQTMKLYKERGINPFASLFLILIQLPILIALYQVFRSGLPKIVTTNLYSFVHNPGIISMTFLGLALTGTSIVFAAIATITQFIQLQLSLPKAKKSNEPSFQNDLAYSMNVQMKYIFPLVIFPIAYISPVVAIYLSASNIFMIGQELFVRRRMAQKMTLSQ